MQQVRPDDIDLLTPGPGLYARVRAGFVAQQDSLQQWCSRNSIKRQNARKCLLGQWRGQKAEELKHLLVREAMIDG